MPLPPTRAALARSIAIVLVLALALVPAASLAADEDDFLSEDYSSDDFLKDDYTEPEEVKKKGVAHWAFYVPVDILLARPFALNDTIIGAVFFTAAVPILGLSGGLKSSWDYIVGDGWYFDKGNLQAALQICIQDPGEYLWNRPLGELSSGY